MEIYDISQELFGCSVYPGDPVPKRELLASMEKGDLYNLTALSLCAHNGTHVDAPAHFIADGKTVDALSLSALVGDVFVLHHTGDVTATDAVAMLARAREAGAERRLLIGGDAMVTRAAAEVFAKAGLLLLGNESQTVGPEEAPMAVHKILLGADCVLLEGVRLSAVPEGRYLLSAAPLLLGGAEGAPCRAILIAP